MGDIGDTWRDMKPLLKEQNRERKEANLQKGVKQLEELKVPFVWRSDTHVVVTVKDCVWDYWPSTNKWSLREKGNSRRYSGDLSRFLKEVKSKMGAEDK